MITSKPKTKHLELANKILLKLQYQALATGNDDKFEDWMLIIEDQWLEEIAACLKGNFPDWRE